VGIGGVGWLGNAQNIIRRSRLSGYDLYCDDL
jgi:hypothetical protein